MMFQTELVNNSRYMYIDKDKARFFLLVDLRELYFRSRVGETKKKIKKL